MMLEQASLFEMFPDAVAVSVYSSPVGFAPELLGRVERPLGLIRESQANFDGETYEPQHDRVRLFRTLQRVYDAMSDGRWHTLSELQWAFDNNHAASTPSISARLRDLRKPRFGGHTIERRRVGGGLFEYRLVPNTSQSVPSAIAVW